MSNNIETRLQSIRTSQQEAGKRYSQAEARLDGVAAKKQQITAQLADMGFSTPEEASAEVSRLNSEVDQILQDIEQKVSGL